MFGQRCLNCDEKISKKFQYCPHCGVNVESGDRVSNDYGFLGKSDEMDMKLPFGFNALMKPLMKELTKQMRDLDKEIQKEEHVFNKDKKNMANSFSIHIGFPGQKPIKISSSNGLNTQVAKKVSSNLPKISQDKLDSVKSFPREEPETNVRRFSDRVVYELDVPGVSSIGEINISKLEDSIEIKAIGKEVVYVKNIDVALPLIRYGFKNDLIVLELGLK
mgnify:CR=1 FL=1